MNKYPQCPEWNDFSKDRINDEKFNIEFPQGNHMKNTTVTFPGYIENKSHPFTFCRSITCEDENGKLTNKFSSSDTYTTFKKNLKRQPEDWKYRHKEITYMVNSSGYRTYEWNDIDWKNSIVIFGCSCTYGVGLAENETISYYIQKYTNKKVVNLGYPSGSNKLIVDNAASMLKHFEMPYAVIINWSTSDRTRFYHENGYYDVGPWDSTEYNNYEPPKSKWSVDMNDYWIKTFYNPTNELALNYYWSTYTDAMFYNRTKYIKISFFPTTAHITRVDKSFSILNEARDCVHPGEKNSIEIARYIAERLDS